MQSIVLGSSVQNRGVHALFVSIPTAAVKTSICTWRNDANIAFQSWRAAAPAAPAVIGIRVEGRAVYVT